MSQCYNSGDFRKYFTENMKDLGLPVPTSTFDTYATAVATASAMVGALGTLGKTATMAELVGATLVTEKFLVLGAIGASWYTGAAIGSIAVATGRSLGCGTRIADMFVFINRNKLQFESWQTFYAQNPQIIDPARPFRRNYGIRAMAA